MPVKQHKDFPFAQVDGDGFFPDLIGVRINDRSATISKTFALWMQRIVCNRLIRVAGPCGFRKFFTPFSEEQLQPFRTELEKLLSHGHIPN